LGSPLEEELRGLRIPEAELRVLARGVEDVADGEAGHHILLFFNLHGIERGSSLLEESRAY
jgi:hypothetical protein